jgi:hypothetical protein
MQGVSKELYNSIQNVTVWHLHLKAHKLSIVQGVHICDGYVCINVNSVACVSERTIRTERPLFVGEVSVDRV